MVAPNYNLPTRGFSMQVEPSCKGRRGPARLVGSAILLEHFGLTKKRTAPRWFAFFWRSSLLRANCGGGQKAMHLEAGPRQLLDKSTRVIRGIMILQRDLPKANPAFGPGCLNHVAPCKAKPYQPLQMERLRGRNLSAGERAFGDCSLGQHWNRIKRTLTCF